MKLEQITNCHVCGCNSLTPLLNIPVPDIMTDEEVIRQVLVCNDCDTIHYIEDDGSIAYEFSCRINEEIGRKVDDKQENKITSQLSKLEQIVAWFESQEEVDVEAGLTKVKEGAELIKELKSKLKKV